MLARSVISSISRTLPVHRASLHGQLYTKGARNYALSRYRDRDSRLRTTNRRPNEAVNVGNQKLPPEVVADNELLLSHNPGAGGLEHLLSQDTLVVTRQIEMMNIFMGFEVANRYAINDLNGNVLGFIAEEERGFLGTIARQAFKTHRAFRSVIMDSAGTPVLWIHRPFSWINSRLYVQRKLQDPTTGEEQLVNYGEAQQEWHLWRRKYHLFLEKEKGDFAQFARIDAGLWAWHFFLQNEEDANIGSIRRGFKGFGREIFTDTGEYTINFRPDAEAPSLLDGGENRIPSRTMSLEERALVLALSVGIDFDFFSRHSEGGGIGLPLVFWGGGE